MAEKYFHVTTSIVEVTVDDEGNSDYTAVGGDAAVLADCDTLEQAQAYRDVCVAMSQRPLIRTLGNALTVLKDASKDRGSPHFPE